MKSAIGTTVMYTVGIAIGERELWGKGYGTDAMRIILQYAFTELNLWRSFADHV